MTGRLDRTRLLKGEITVGVPVDLRRTADDTKFESMWIP